MPTADFQTVIDEANRRHSRYHADRGLIVFGEAPPGPSHTALPQMDLEVGRANRSLYHPEGWSSVFGEIKPAPPGPALPQMDLEVGRARRSLYNPNGWLGAGMEEFGVTGAQPVNLLLGTTQNGYGVEKDAFGNAYVVKYVSGTKTALATIPLPNDNLYHTFKLSIVPGASNTIEASIDGTKFAIQTDSSLTLTSGTWPISMSGGSVGGARHFNAKMSVGHHTASSAQVQSAIQSTADGHGSYVTHGTIYQEHIVGMTGTGSVNLDGLPDGSTYNRVKATEMTTGFIKQLNDGTNVRNAAAVATNMDTSGNSKLNEFSGGGVVENPDGSWSGFSSSGTTSTPVYKFSNNAWVYAETHFNQATTGHDVFLIVGNTTNGYGISWNHSTNFVSLSKWVSGTKTDLATVLVASQDINVHMMRLTVKAGATTNTIEASFDNNLQMTTDAVSGGVMLTTGTWGITILDGANGTSKFFHFDVESSQDHYTKLVSQAQSVVASGADTHGSYLQHGIVYQEHIVGMTGTGSVNLDGLPDGTTYQRVKATELTTGFVKQLNDGTNVRTAAQLAGAVDTSSRIIGSIYDGTNTRTPANITTAIDGSGRIIGSIYDGTNTRTPASITATILAAGGIDFSSALHTNKNLDNIADGSTYGRVKLTELTSNTVKQLNDGTNIRTAAQVANALDTSSNLKVNPWGASSGVVFANATGALTGFAATTGTTSQQTYPMSIGTPLVVSGTITLPATGNVAGIYLGNTTNGYGIEWTTAGVVALVKYVSSTRTVLSTIYASFPQDTKPHSFSLTAVVTANGPVSTSLAAAFDYTTSGSSVADGGFNPANAGITVVAGGTGGLLQNFYVEYGMVGGLSNVVSPFSDANGSFLNDRIVFAQQISWASGTPTGSVSLDTVPDGTTYARVNASNLNSNNLYTPFASTAVIWGSDGSLSNFPGAAVSSTAAFPIKAAYPIIFSGWIKLGGTTGSCFFLIGNETNGLGLRWNGSGLVSPVTIKAGVVTVGTTLATVTRDTVYHWVSVKLTPGTTPGTSDVYVIYFDTNTVSTTSGSAAVTWGSTATVTFDGGTVAGSSLLDHRISSNQS